MYRGRIRMSSLFGPTDNGGRTRGGVCRRLRPSRVQGVTNPRPPARQGPGSAATPGEPAQPDACRQETARRCHTLQQPEREATTVQPGAAAAATGAGPAGEPTGANGSRAPTAVGGGSNQVHADNQPARAGGRFTTRSSSQSLPAFSRDRNWLDPFDSRERQRYKDRLPSVDARERGGLPHRGRRSGRPSTTGNRRAVVRRVKRRSLPLPWQENARETVRNVAAVEGRRPEGSGDQNCRWLCRVNCRGGAGLPGEAR